MNPLTSLSLPDASAELAAMMVAFEAQNGEVQTEAIRIGDPRPHTFSINVPGKPKAKPSRTLRQMDHKRAVMNTVKKTKAAIRLETIRDMAIKGATVDAMATATNISPTSVMRLLREKNIPRGPKMDLEA